jgi:hypothetical protein
VFGSSLFFDLLEWLLRGLGRAGVGGGPDEDEGERETRQWRRIEGVPSDGDKPFERQPFR